MVHRLAVARTLRGLPLVAAALRDAPHKELELTERLCQAAQEGGAPMDDLEKLIEAARGVIMTPDERERQRQSFAFGNAHIENEFVTRETISRAAAELESGDRE